MKKKQTAFKIGDAVFYPSAGVGIVVGIEDIFIGGQCDSCFVVRIQESALIVKVPKSTMSVSGIRHLMDGKRVKELYKILAADGPRRVTGGNWTERCKELERKINQGSYLELGEVVRDLMRWKSQTGLSFEESMLLETARGHLVNELVTVQGVSPEVAVSTIRNKIGIAA